MLYTFGLEKIGKKKFRNLEISLLYEFINPLRLSLADRINLLCYFIKFILLNHILSLNRSRNFY